MEELWRKWEHNIQRLPRQLVIYILSSRTWSENLDHLGLAGPLRTGGEKDGDRWRRSHGLLGRILNAIEWS